MHQGSRNHGRGKNQPPPIPIFEPISWPSRRKSVGLQNPDLIDSIKFGNLGMHQLLTPSFIKVMGEGWTFILQ
jgi:hypothetical protein